MTIRFYRGQPLFVGGQLAMSESCCCGSSDPCDSPLAGCCGPCRFPTRGNAVGGVIADDITTITDFDVRITNINGVAEDRFLQVPLNDGSMSQHFVRGLVWDLPCCPEVITWSSRCTFRINLRSDALGFAFQSIVQLTGTGWVVRDEATGNTLAVCGPCDLTTCDGFVEANFDNLIGGNPVTATGGFNINNGEPHNQFCTDEGWITPCDCTAFAACKNDDPSADLEWIFPTASNNGADCNQPSFPPAYLGQRTCDGNAAGPGAQLAAIIDNM